MFLTNVGSFAWNLPAGAPGLEYPRGSGRHVLYAGGIWVGAQIAGEPYPRVTVAEYSWEYIPGRIKAEGVWDPDWRTNPRWRVYKIYRGDTAESNPDYAEWPVDDGAPVDEMGRPRRLGSQTCWAVYNDADTTRHTTLAGGSLPLGIEIQQTTFAREDPQSLRNAVFIEWKIINKGPETFESTYISAWSDPDIGESTDDLVGYDPPSEMGYAYNGSISDNEYLTYPPAVGIQLVQGPIVPSPGDEAYVSGRIIPDYRNLPAASFNKYINGADPQSATESYNYMQGLKEDGSPVVDPTTLEETTFQVPGDPVTGTGWIDTNPDDRRMMLSCGPFQMAPGDTQTVAFAVLAGQGADRLDSITRLRAEASHARDLFRAIYSEEVGACCMPYNGVCVVVEESACPGEFLVGETCDPAPCRVVEGACCLAYGGCLLVPPQDCPADYLGDGTTCDPNPCPEPVAGACCTDYECVTTLESDCAGIFQGEGTECEPGSCSGIIWDWRPDPRWLTWVDWGGSTFNGGFGFGFEFFGSTLTREEVTNTEIRFEADESEWSECQTYRRDLGYVPGGIGTFPGSAWDISDPDAPRRVNINYVEFDTPEKPANHLWDPDESEWGGREYLFIMKSDYDGGVSYGDGTELPDGTSSDVMFTGWTRVRPGYEFLQAVPAYLRFYVGTPEDPFGACCMTDGSCVIAPRTECSGTFQGDSAPCSPNPCEVTTAVDGVDRPSVPAIFFHAPLPNPTDGAITLPFGLARPTDVEIRIYNVGGALVRTLVDGTVEGGTHQVAWNRRDERGREVAPGVYYARMTAGKFDASRKLVIAR